MLHKAFAVLPVVGFLAGAGCGCPHGNAVEAARLVQAEFQLVTPAVAYAGHASSAPGGGAISFDRATIPVVGRVGPAAATDMVLSLMAPGCRADPSGALACDSQFNVTLTIHGVSRPSTLPLTIALDDGSAALRLESSPLSTGMVPCTGKPGLDGLLCPDVSDSGASSDATVSYSGVQGQLILTSLDENCTDVLSICALTAAGTFQVSAMGPAGEALSLGAGTILAMDTLMYRDTCPN